MEEAVRDLVLAPFADMVEKGRAATENAREANSAQMLKAAQNLVREGERALKRIEPVCRKHLDDFAGNFVVALKENDEIAQYRTDLVDLLWAFDDFIEPDEFDAEKYTELQGLSRKAAPRILDALVRMKLEAPEAQAARAEAASPSPAATPATAAAGLAAPGETSNEQAATPNSASTDQAGDEESDLRSAMGAQSGPDLGLDGMLPQQHEAAPAATNNVPSRNSSRRSVASSVPEEVPPEPEVNPWHVGARPAIETIHEVNEADEAEVERRERVQTRPDSPTLPPSPTSPHVRMYMSTSPGRLDVGVDRMLREAQEQQRRGKEPGPGANGSTQTIVARPEGPPASQIMPLEPTSPVTSGGPGGGVIWRPTANGFPAPSPSSPSVPAQRAWPLPSQAGSHTSAGSSQLLFANGQPHSPNASPRYSQASTATSTGESQQSSTFDSHHSRDSLYDAVSPTTSNNRTSLLSAAGHSPVAPVLAVFGSPSGSGSPSTVVQPAQPVQPVQPLQPVPPVVPDYGGQQQQTVVPPVQPAAPVEQPGLEPIVNAGVVDHGLIPVEPPDHRGFHALGRFDAARQPDCTIGAASSFHLFKGFCEGAKEVQRGGAGVKQTRKLGFSGGAVVAAKCKNCLYELEWQQVDADRKGYDNVNYKSSGINFRLRFLQKSHLSTRHVEEQLYGCLFCQQMGRTPEESDATVFFTQAQLFSHLARHPRPLPAVQGLTVIDAPEIPPAFRNDFDLHFVNAPRPSEMEGIRREVQQLPTATAVDTFRKTHNSLRRPPGGAEPLQFAAGSKIVGVEFPARYGGEWAVGWFDNVRAPFPAEAVRLEPPPKSEVRLQGSTPLRATVRWKWAPKDRERGDWLKLDKGETISNISWAYPGHWCWSGTNAKGKWGIFPQSHIEPNSLKEVPSHGDGASISSGSGSGSGGRGSRDKHDRKASTSSGGGGGGGSGSGGGGLLSKISIRHNASYRRPGSSASSSPSHSSHETAVAARDPMSPRAPSVY